MGKLRKRLQPLIAYYRKYLIVFLSFAFFYEPSLGARDSDLVIDLPGLSFDPGFKQYAGYLDASPNNHLFYWFVESQGNPEKDPLTLWLNGGPGCSSLGGFMTENGPFHPMPDGQTLVENIHSWNKAANVLFLESPFGVGFSYRDASAPTDDYYTDDKTAADNALAIKSFLQAFPEYQNRDFYVTGESYGGVYVPTLSRVLINMIKNGSMTGLNFKGFAIGNGMLSVPQQTNSAPGLLYFRGMIGVEQWESLQACCVDNSTNPLEYCDFSQFVTVDDYGNVNPSNSSNDPMFIACSNYVTKMAMDFVWGTTNDVYNSYQDCYNLSAITTFPDQNSMMTQSLKRFPLKSHMVHSSSGRLYQLGSSGVNPFVDQYTLMNYASTDSLRNFPCYSDDATRTYLNLPDVRSALHVSPSIKMWQDCNLDINGNYYHQSTHDTTPVFKDMIDTGYPLRILIYNGDVDMACNFLGDEWFIEKLATSVYNFTLTGNRFPWTYQRPGPFQNVIGGYVKSWSYANITLDLLTVKGAGHFVPQDRPAPALQMFYNYINGSGNYNSTVPYMPLGKPLKPQYQKPQQKVWTRKQADRVWVLPGITYPLNFKQYSGYLNGVTGNYLHYWLVESQSNPLADPLVLWITGGPGCSGLLAFFSENGPFHPNPDGKTLFENVFAWNKGANYLYIESPRNVGFSVQDKGLNNDTVYDDDRTAMDTMLALKDFLTVFPEYQGRQFFITGESYGGVYVPTLTSLLIDNIQAGNLPGLNLVGIAIGNGELSSLQQLNSAIHMGYFHGLYDKGEFDSLQACCDNSTGGTWFEYCDFSKYVRIGSDGTAYPIDNSACAQTITDLGQARFWNLGTLTNVYNIYQDCYEETSFVFGSRVKNVDRKRMLAAFVNQAAKISHSSTDNQGGFQCYSTDASAAYLNRWNIRQVLHVAPQAGNWSACNDDINANYIQQHNDTGPVFDHILKSGYPLRVLIYNGDTDQACNFLGDQWFVEAFANRNGLQLSKARKDWRYMTQIAGYGKQFTNDSAKFSIDLLTVKGAGHLVPVDRPGPALQMITNFFRNQDYSNPVNYDTQQHYLSETYKIAQRVSAAAMNVSIDDLITQKSVNPNKRGSRKMYMKGRRSQGQNLVKLSDEMPAIRKLAEGLEGDAPPPPPAQDKTADQVRDLPGLTFTPTFAHYSGYLNASQGNYLHYWFVECQSDPTNAPLILWLNGGPGCSSMGGLLEELGPFHVNQDGITLFENVYSWNKVGNVLFLESPRDVGYSYRSNEVPPDNLYNDDKTANDTVIALASFFAKFPEYNNRPFFITGESYGGVYVPTLTWQLIQEINSQRMSYVNLQGIAIGNGEMSEIQQINSAVPLLYFRGEHGKEDWDALTMCCNSTSTPQTYCDFTSYIYLDAAGNAWPKVNDDSLAGKCGRLIVQQGFLDVWTTDNDVYNTFSDCYVVPGSVPESNDKKEFGARRKREIPPLMNKRLYINQAAKINYWSTDANQGFTCFSGDTAESFMNQGTTRQALHIQPALGHWSDCNDHMNDIYQQQHNDTTDVFMRIFGSGYKLRILIYNGDVDMACQFLGDQWFIEKLAAGAQMQAGKRNPWNYTQGSYLSRTGGYVKRFTYNGTQIILDQMTVKGGGHFVPTDRPGPALQMIYNFVNNLDWNKNMTLSITPQPLLPEYQSFPPTMTRRLADQIFALPGLTFQPTYHSHAGYLTASPGNYLFYWFFESQGDPSVDPVILWLQGGPGCASSGGALGEIGPFFANPDGTTLFENVYSWNKPASILVLDSPRMVGFSYQDNTTNKDQTWNDDKTADDVFLAVTDFFKAYAKFKKNPFYITGESYGGIYVPVTTRKFIQMINSNKSDINLVGMAIGNGMVSNIQDVRTLPDFMYMHGFYGKDIWDQLRKCCNRADNTTSYYCTYDDYIYVDDGANILPKMFNDSFSQNCANLIVQLSYQRNWHSGNDVYNLYLDCYDYPIYSNAALKMKAPSEITQNSRWEVRKLISNIQPKFVDSSQFDPLNTDNMGSYQCWNYGAIDNYLNQPHVRDALHVPDFVQDWTFCTGAINYTMQYNDTTQVFTDIIDSNYTLKMLIYNGDADTACSMFEAQGLIEDLARSQYLITPQPRAAWNYAGVVAGYVKKFQKNNAIIDLMTVKGAGHAVPLTRPGPALQMITNFVGGQPDYSTPVSFDMRRQPLLPQFTEQGAGDNPSQTTTMSPQTSQTTNPTAGTSSQATQTSGSTQSSQSTTSKLSISRFNYPIISLLVAISLLCLTLLHL